MLLERLAVDGKGRMCGKWFYKYRDRFLVYKPNSKVIKIWEDCMCGRFSKLVLLSLILIMVCPSGALSSLYSDKLNIHADKDTTTCKQLNEWLHVSFDSIISKEVYCLSGFSNEWGDSGQHFESSFKDAEAVGLVIQSTAQNANRINGATSNITVLVLKGKAGNINYRYNGSYAKEMELQQWSAYGGDSGISGNPDVGDIVLWFPKKPYAYGWFTFLIPENRDKITEVINSQKMDRKYKRASNKDQRKIQNKNKWSLLGKTLGGTVVYFRVKSDGKDNKYMYIKEVFGDSKYDIITESIRCVDKTSKTDRIQMFDENQNIIQDIDNANKYKYEPITKNSRIMHGYRKLCK